MSPTVEPPWVAEAVALYRAGGMGYGRIAKQLGVKAAQVKYRLKKAGLVPTAEELYVEYGQYLPDPVLSPPMADAVGLIRAEMKRQGLTQAALARRLGWTDAAVSSVFNGHSRPSAARLERILAALGIGPRPVPDPELTRDAHRGAR